MAVLSEEIPGNKEREEGSGQFEGYGTPNFVMLPRIFIRHQMQDLTEAELKVMLYIFDHTWGYTDGEGNRKDADAISRSQFLNGIRRLDGTRLDRGAGVSDRSLDRALDNLVKRGYIFRHRRMSASGRSDTNIYELNRYGKPCLAPTGNTDGVTANNRLAVGEHVPAQAFIRPENVRNGSAGQDLLTEPEKQFNNGNGNGNGNPRKFTPLNSSGIESTPANLRPSLPANLRPSTPANLPDTIENPNNKKIKQHTTQSNSQDLPGGDATLPDPHSKVCVSVSSNEKSEEQPIASNNQNPGVYSGGKTIGDHAVPAHLTAPAEKVKPAMGARQTTKDPVQEELAADLLKAGVAKKEAEYLAALARQNNHNSDYVKQALQYIDRQRSVHSREGLLIHLVKTNWQPSVQEASGSNGLVGSNTSGMVVPLPSASSIRPDQLPRLIEIEKRNLQEASSDFERETARARLVHFQAIAAQSGPNPNTVSHSSTEEKKG